MLKDLLRAELDHELATTKRLLDRIPPGKLAWKPHEKSMTLGGLGTHLANIPSWTPFILDRLELDLADAPRTLGEPGALDDILSLFEATRAAARTALEKTDAELAALWLLRKNGQELFAMPRLSAYRSFVVNHLIHHRGQLSVYLRLNDVAVPAIYGPTADEG
jgi:uncharacterized damage-inducible protein DinB